MARKAVRILALLLATALFFACCKGKNRAGGIPIINTDSLFIDLNRETLAKKAQQADALFSRLHRYGMNGVVLYAEQGQIVYEKAFGCRDLNHPKDLLTVLDTFQISSDSKMFTAEAVMMLKAQHRLDYDDDVRLYIPELPYKGITIRQLLTHRSGLPRYDAMADAHWPDRSKPFTNDDLLKMLAQYKPDPYGQPDASFFYNNINYALLATVVERASQRPFEDFMRDSIFLPLGMTHSFIYSMRNETRVPPYLPITAQGHEITQNNVWKVTNNYLNGVMGDKIMCSTVEDLLKFNNALDAHALLPDSLQAEAFRPRSDTWTNGENYGFGWRISQQYPDMPFHYGWWKGYRSAVIRNMAHDRFLVVLSNTSQTLATELMWDFITDTTLLLPKASLLQE